MYSNSKETPKVLGLILRHRFAIKKPPKTKQTYDIRSLTIAKAIKIAKLPVFHLNIPTLSTTFQHNQAISPKVGALNQELKTFSLKILYLQKNIFFLAFSIKQLFSSVLIPSKKMSQSGKKWED
jgi:hypothetical protein